DTSNRRVFPNGSFDWTGKYLETVSEIEKLESTGNPSIFIVRRFDDIARAKREKRPAVIFSNEGSLPLGPRLEHFDQLYRRGLRDIGLFGPAGNHTDHIVQSEGRLTPLGFEIIGKAGQLGVTVDTCHLADKPAFWQTLEASPGPLVHSHGAGRFPRSP